MNLLKKLSIGGYRSIKEVDGLELKPLNVVIGANGTGKSNFISFFHMLNYAMSRNLQLFIEDNGWANSLLHNGSRSTPTIKGELEFQAFNGLDRYRFELSFAAINSLIYTDEYIYFLADDREEPYEKHLGAGHKESALFKEVKNNNQTARFIKRHLERCRVYQFHDTSTSSFIRKPSQISDNRYLRASGGNLSAVLYELKQQNPETFERIVEVTRSVMPYFKDFVLEPEQRHPNTIVMRWRSRYSDYLMGPHQMSDGGLRFMSLATLLLQPVEDLPNMVIIDEPELGLDPVAESVVAGLLRDVSQHTQILVATHSTSFLENFEADEIIVADMEDQGTTFSRLDKKELEDWLDRYAYGDSVEDSNSNIVKVGA